MAAKRRIKQNIWGNWCGYLGRARVQEFGTDEVAAGYWSLTGEVDFYAGYDEANIEAVRAEIGRAISGCK